MQVLNVTKGCWVVVQLHERESTHTITVYMFLVGSKSSFSYNLCKEDVAMEDKDILCDLCEEW